MKLTRQLTNTHKWYSPNIELVLHTLDRAIAYCVSAYLTKLKLYFSLQCWWDVKQKLNSQIFVLVSTNSNETYKYLSTYVYT